MDYYEEWKSLAAQIIIEIMEDYKATSDVFLKKTLLKWFDTDYGTAICELAGIDPYYIKREVQRIERNKKY